MQKSLFAVVVAALIFSACRDRNQLPWEGCEFNYYNMRNDETRDINYDQDTSWLEDSYGIMLYNKGFQSQTTGRFEYNKVIKYIELPSTRRQFILSPEGYVQFMCEVYNSGNYTVNLPHTTNFTYRGSNTRFRSISYERNGFLFEHNNLRLGYNRGENPEYGFWLDNYQDGVFTDSVFTAFPQFHNTIDCISEQEIKEDLLIIFVDINWD